MGSSNQQQIVRDRSTEPSSPTQVATRQGAESGSVSNEPPAWQDALANAGQSDAADTSTTSNAGEGKPETTATAFDTETSCTECGESEFATGTSGEWYCRDCGAVHSGVELEFSEPGWTAWTERRGGPSGSASRLAVGTTVGGAGSSSEPRWAQYNRRLSHEESTLRHGLKEIRALAAALEAAESTTESAAVTFRRSADAGLLVGQSVEAVAAASIYLVAREHGRPFPLAHVVAASPVDRQAVKSAYSKLVREFDAAVAPPLPTAFIQRFASAVGVSQSVRRLAMDVASAVVEDGVHVGQSPTGVAAAVVYGAARSRGKDVTQEELTDVAFVSVVTLSRQWQRVETYFDAASQ